VFICVKIVVDVKCVHVAGFVQFTRMEQIMKKYSYRLIRDRDGWWIALVVDNNTNKLQARLAGKTEKEAKKRAEEHIKRLEEGSTWRI